MSNDSFYYIVVEIDGKAFYVARGGTYSTDFDMALRFDDREAAESYRVAMQGQHKTKVLRFTA